MKRILPAGKVLLFSFFIGVIFAGSVLLMLPDMWRGSEPIRYVDALFTSVSAVCVTGLVTVNTSEFTTLGQIVIMLLIQTGGLGIVTFSTIYLTGPSAKISLSNRELINEYYVESVEYDPRRIIRNIVILTFSAEAVGTLLLMVGFAGQTSSGLLFTSVFHAVSAFCNAGFSLYDDSMVGYAGNGLVLGVIMALIVLGGLGFVVVQDVLRRLRRREHRLSLHSRVMLVGSLFLIVGGTLFYLVLERRHSMNGMPHAKQWLNALFQSVTTRTAGFNSINEAEMTMPSKALTLLLMFVGGGPGSIAGGVKVTTFFLMLAIALRTGDEAASVRIANRLVSPKVSIRAVSLVVKAIMILAVAVGLLTLTETVIAGHDVHFLDIVFESFSAFGTVGLSLGLTANLTTLGKIVIILTMFAGRVGLVSLAMPSPDQYKERFISYPEGEVLIG
ncbi:TrkH family potassium uptake protein [Salinispira pacifica]